MINLMTIISRSLFLLIPCFWLAGCDAIGLTPDADQKPYPTRDELDIARDRGKLTGEGLILAGGSEKDEEASSPLGVNSFLWRATLDTLAFMPLASADPFGGVILTDWYEDPKARGERFKISILILGRALRADGLNASLFKQERDPMTNEWRDATIDGSLTRKLEDRILTRARQLRISGRSE